MKKKPFVLLPFALLLVVSVSGCTSIPGLEWLCIPGITCSGGTVEYENDMLVIKTLDAVPSTISTGQQFRLSAWVQNNGAETVPQSNFKSEFNEKNLGYYITVKLYDSCEGLFKEIKVTCPDQKEESKIKEGTKETGCRIESLLPKQTIPVTWSLVAYDNTKIPLETSCNLKIYVQYPYRTKSMTSVSFVDYTEYQRMLDEGKFTATTSYITEGYGPMKPYLLVKDTQPIPVKNGVASKTAMAFQVKNKGSGFLTAFRIDSNGNDLIKVLNTQTTDNDILIESNSKQYNIGELIRNEIKKIKDIGLVGKESAEYFFSIDSPTNNQVEKVATYYVTSSIDYMYEFRKETKVTIKPPLITS
ncbi:MAG TPA: hypothetical protein VJ485_02665 [archaeon]|nr:hypothetical protein [archaeon]